MNFEFTNYYVSKENRDSCGCVILWSEAGADSIIEIWKRYDGKGIAKIDKETIPLSFASMLFEHNADGAIQPSCDCCQHKMRCLLSPRIRATFTLI